MQTWQDIKDFFWSAVQDTEAGQMFFSETQVINWFNGAVVEIGQHAQVLDDIHTEGTVDGTALYDIGGYGALGVWRVEIDDEAIRAITQAALRRSDRDWKTKSGRPKFYYMDDINTDPDKTYIGLWEKPNGVYAIRAYYYGEPSEIDEDTLGTARPQIPEWSIYAILWYMLSEAYMAETRRQNFDTAAFYRMLFEDTLDRLQIRTSNRLAKSWVYGSGRVPMVDDITYNLPDTIPEPS